MTVQERVLYASENGDRWSLLREPATGRLVVRHQPNESSGGQSSDVDVGTFLTSGSMGPEKQALLAQIEGLVSDDKSERLSPVHDQELTHDVWHALREIEMLLNTLVRHPDGVGGQGVRDDLLRTSRELGLIGQRLGSRVDRS